MIAIIVIVALAAPLVAYLTGHGPNEEFQTVGLTPDGLPRPPSRTFLFGTDDLGRDVLVRVVYGARISLLSGVLASSVAVALGVLVGLVGGYFGGIVDTILARLMDVVLSFPFLLFAIALVSITGPGLWVSIFVIAFFSWASVGRVVRGQTLSLREREYVEAARSLGAGDLRIMFVDILPEPRRAGHRLPDAADPVGGRLRGHALVPRARRRAARRDVGQHALGVARLLPRRVVVRALPRRRAPDHDAGLQPARRQRARCVRPARRAALPQIAMLAFLLRRIVLGVAVLWAITTVVFIMFFVAPTHVAQTIAGRQATPETVALVSHRLGLDRPILTQYANTCGGSCTAISATRTTTPRRSRR